MCIIAYACSPDIYQDSLYEYKLKNIAKPKDGTSEGFVENIESSEEALELIQNTNDDSQSVLWLHMNEDNPDDFQQC
jgi:hypothetical protein